MKKLKTICFAICTLLSGLSLAQESPIQLIERANAADYIFEGLVISSTPYLSNNGRTIHTSNTIEISRMLKGDLVCGTVELITNGGSVDNRSMNHSHHLELKRGSMGIFLCDLSDKPLSIVDFYPENNSQVLDAKFESQSFIRYWWDGQQLNAADLWANFDSLSTVYNLTELITGLQYTECNNAASQQIEQLNHPQTTASPSLITAAVDITSLSHDTIAAGRDDTLTIYGSGFGANRGNGNVFFKNADDGGVSEIYLADTNYIISWADDKIECYVPGLRHKTDSTAEHGATSYDAGSGPVKVVSNNGLSTGTSDYLYIEYNIRNYRGNRTPVLLAPWAQANNKYVFRCTPEVAAYDNGNMKLVIEKALADWKCLTGIHWELGLDTNSNALSSTDTLNLIAFGELDAPAVARAISTEAGGAVLGYIIETDIIIDPSFDYHCDPNGTNPPTSSNLKDFYLILLHELGHAHGLGHVIDSTAIMFFQERQEASKILGGDVSCDNGGNWILSNSLSIQLGSASEYLNVDADSIQPCSELSIEEIFNQKELNIFYYPSPVRNLLELSFRVFSDVEFEITVVDLNGKKRLTRHESLISGENQLQLDLSQLERGVYFLNLRSMTGHTNAKSVKLIKL